MGQGQGDHPAGQGDEQQHAHRAPLAEPQEDQAVAGVVAAALGDGPAVGGALEGDQGGVEDGHHQRAQGDQQGQDQVGGPARVLGLQDGQGGQGEAQEERAAVAHEYLGRVEVVDQETGRGAGQGRAKSGRGRRAAQPGGQGQDQPGHAGHPGAEPVHVVQDVYRVGNPHQPEDAQGHGQPGPGDHGQPHPQGHRRDGHQKLHQELELGAQFHGVVYEPQQEQGPAATQDGPGQITARAQDQQHGGKGGEHGHPAVDRGGLLVPAVLAGLDQPAEAVPQPDHHRREGGGQGKCSQKG